MIVRVDLKEEYSNDNVIWVIGIVIISVIMI